jgi:putative colanic acid biosynthesis UDP-glucose lipid carrier transferase
MENILTIQKSSRSVQRNSNRNITKNADQFQPKDLSGDFSKRLLKRVFDLVFSLVTVIFFLSWMFPVLAIMIKLDSKGPVFFRQLRHGRGNRHFYCYKFRTMVINDEADIKQATQDDSRVTRIGKFLRRTSMDELPQVFNVILGNMSIVGPRPHAVPMNIEFAKEIDNFMVRHAVKPGITGLAQAKGYRGEIKNFYDIYSRFKLDYFYVRNWCLLLDIKIVIETANSLIYNNHKAY